MLGNNINTFPQCKTELLIHGLFNDDFQLHKLTSKSGMIVNHDFKGTWLISRLSQYFHGEAEENHKAN